MKIISYILILSASTLVLSGCIQSGISDMDKTVINYDHLIHLYLEIDLPNGQESGIIHIYSEYPDYKFEIEPDEGFTCVDDVARAMILQSMRDDSNDIVPGMYDRMAKFLLYMQNENGYFHNFIWHDLSINDTFRTSLAEPNWWSWRAFWALSSFKTNDKDLQERVNKACQALANNVIEEYIDAPLDTMYFNGLAVPSWLPLQTAGDQAAVLMLGLTEYFKNISRDNRALELIEKLANGLLLTQHGDENRFPFGAFLSWRNLWHSYGNIQAYALMTAGELMDRQEYIESALLEIDHFYPYLAKDDIPRAFTLEYKENDYYIKNSFDKTQIAYDFRPMIWACAKAFSITGKDKYLHQAMDIAKWFAGNNIAGHMMYNPENGICYDGIISETEVNLNSGAESTIEALLSFQMLEQFSEYIDITSIYDE